MARRGGKRRLLPQGNPAVPGPAAPQRGSATPPQLRHMRYMPRASSTMASCPPPPMSEAASRTVQTPQPGGHAPRPLRRWRIGGEGPTPGRMHSPWRQVSWHQEQGIVLVRGYCPHQSPIGALINRLLGLGQVPRYLIYLFAEVKDWAGQVLAFGREGERNRSSRYSLHDHGVCSRQWYISKPTKKVQVNMRRELISRLCFFFRIRWKSNGCHSAQTFVDDKNMQVQHDFYLST